MRKTKFQRIASFLLVLCMLACGGTVAAAAESQDGTVLNPSVTDKTIEDYKEELESISYSEYVKSFVGIADATETIIVDPIRDLDMSKTTLGWLSDEDFAKLVADKTLASSLVGIYQTQYDGRDALYTPGDGTVTFTLSDVKEGLYSIRIIYYPVEGKATSIEREFYINGKAPFKEARSLTIPKVWKNQYQKYDYLVPKKANADEIESRAKAIGLEVVRETREDGTHLTFTMPMVWTEATSAFLLDEIGARFFVNDLDTNELRPGTVQMPEWCAYDLMDSQGYYAESFKYLLAPNEDGKLSISLKGMNEPMAIAQIILMPQESIPTYQEYIAKYQNANKGTSYIKLEAELPSGVSTNTVYPAEDRASAATSPADPSRVMLNVIGGEKWQTPGQALYYTFEVGSTGLYSIDMRFRQNVLDGLFVSRSISLYSDGVEAGADGYYNGYPFLEAAQARFNYSGYWQSTGMTDGSVDAFEFYFVEGVTYTLKLEVTLGTMSTVISEIEDVLNHINDDYLQIIRLTGTKPDDYRDYNFKRVMPATLADLIIQSNRLEAISNSLKEIAGTASSTVATLDKVHTLLVRMEDEDEIARNLETLKSYIGSLGTFLTEAKKQPLQMDYIVIQSPDAELPTAEPGFFAKLWHEINSFIQSFLRDYNSMGSMTEIENPEDVLEVWVAYGRDQSQVIRNLVTNEFTPESDIPVDLKLITGGTLLPSILAGMGPDVYLGIGAGEVINYAIRGALATIDVDSQGNKREDFEEVTNRFTESAMLVLGITNSEGDLHYYGLPEVQGFPMLFVRIDILAEMNIPIPKTWQDIYSAQTELEGNNMEIGLTTDYKMFLYQNGGELFADGGMRINLDSEEGLNAFETMCNLFTMRSFPYQYDAANRFRTGEMPIVIADYCGMYNQLKVFATEIDGLWKFVPLPGVEDKETGKINNASVSGVSADVMIGGTDHEEWAWEYLKWYTGASCQTQYANEMVAIMGDSAKHNTANKEALASMPWTTEEYTEVNKQFQNLAAIPNYPGAYYIDRYTNFAFLDAYNNDADPVTELLSYINLINKEITRKRAEFNLETLEIGQTLADKRGAQALEALEYLVEMDGSYSAAYTLVKNAIADENIVILQETSADLMTKLASVDAASYTLRIFKQDQDKDNGGYKIKDLNQNQLIYFAAQCLAEAAQALSEY